ncbi:MAG: hypothetical protein QW675_08280, partial [Nitrososphaerota archaeon]
STARLIIYRKLSEKYTPHRPKLKTASPYIAASLIMAAILLLSRTLIDPRAPRLAETLPPLFLLVTLGATTYFIILYFMSKDFKILLNDIRAFLRSHMIKI